MKFEHRPINLTGVVAAGAALFLLILAASAWQGRLRSPPTFHHPSEPTKETRAVQRAPVQAPQPAHPAPAIPPAPAPAPRSPPSPGPTTAVFRSIYDTRLWGEGGGGSGDGSTLDYTRRTRLIVELLATRYGVKTLMDAPCGAMAWMPAVVDRLRALDPGFSYLGVDVVPTVIEGNRAKFAGRGGYAFEVADFGTPMAALPAGADLVWCRDALQHLPFDLIVNALENFSRAPGARYLAVGSYKRGGNVPIAAGEYFSIDLRAPPFDLDAPEDVLDEETPDGKLVLVYAMKYLSGVDFGAMRRRTAAAAGAAPP